MNKTLLATADDVQTALMKIAELFDSGQQNILVCNTGASKTQFDKLNKQLREEFYCTRATDGFIVMNRRQVKTVDQTATAIK